MATTSRCSSRERGDLGNVHDTTPNVQLTATETHTGRLRSIGVGRRLRGRRDDHVAARREQDLHDHQRRPAATLTLVKTVVNNNGGRRWSTTSRCSSAATRSTWDARCRATGRAHGDRDDADRLRAVGWGGDCAANGTVTFALGENKTCTITNDDMAPKLTLVKTVINDNGGTKAVNDFPCQQRHARRPGARR